MLLGLAAAAGLGTMVVRDQMTRHRRDLFSPQPLKRFAALGYVSGTPATVALVHLLRDFVAWEPNRILRRRGRTVLRRMERQLQSQPARFPEGMAG